MRVRAGQAAAMLLAGTVVLAGEHPDLSGRWRLNPQLSQDVQAKIVLSTGGDEVKNIGDGLMVVFFFVILGVFSALWHAVGQDGGGAADDGGRSTMVWYLAITEWVLLSAPMLHFEIEAENQNGRHRDADSKCDGLTRRSRCLNDVVFKDGRVAHPEFRKDSEKGNRNDGDGNGCADGQSDLQNQVQ